MRGTGGSVPGHCDVIFNRKERRRRPTWFCDENNKTEKKHYKRLQNITVKNTGHLKQRNCSVLSKNATGTIGHLYAGALQNLSCKEIGFASFRGPVTRP